MATAEHGLRAQVRNIESSYGKPMSDWLAVTTASGLTKHNDVVSMLMSEHGMTHGAAHRVSLAEFTGWLRLGYDGHDQTHPGIGLALQATRPNGIR